MGGTATGLGRLSVDPRIVEIIKTYYGPETLEDTGQRCGLSRERIRQIAEQLGLPSLPKKRNDSLTAVAERIGVSQAVIVGLIHSGRIRVVIRGKRQWRIIDSDAKIRRLLRRGPCRYCQGLITDPRRRTYCSKGCNDQATQHWNNFNDPSYLPNWARRFRKMRVKPGRHYVTRQEAISLSGLSLSNFDLAAWKGWIPRIGEEDHYLYSTAHLDAIRHIHQETCRA